MSHKHKSTTKKPEENNQVAFWLSFSIASILFLIVIALFIRMLVKKQ